MMVPSATAFFEAIAPAMERDSSGDTAGAVDAFLRVVAGPEWRTDVARHVPGGPEQADRDGATFFGVEIPALEKWVFDRARATRSPSLSVCDRG